MFKKITLKDFEKRINDKFKKKYKIDEKIYNKNIIDNIIYNEKSHLVAKFKDYLLEYDEYEFFKRYYSIEESKKRLKKYISYYQKYNCIYPNYTSIPESEYLYKNINRKQRIIDEQQNEIQIKQINKEENKNSKNKENKDFQNNISEKDSSKDFSLNKTHKIFDSKVYESILKSANKSCFSQFGIDKNKEKFDSVKDINGIIAEINNFPTEINNIIKLDDSPAHPIHYNIFSLNENNNNKNGEEEIDNLKKNNKYIYNTNFCYNKFKNRNIKNLLFNKKINQNKQNIQNTPLTNNKINFFSPLYTKVNLRQKTISNCTTINKTTANKNININNNNYINNNNIDKHSFIYRKFSPINKFDRLSFSIKQNNDNKEPLKTITYFPLTTKSRINPINAKKKESLKINIFSNNNKININNLNNHTTKNKNKNEQYQHLNNIQKKNNILYTKRRANSEMTNIFNNNNNYFNYMTSEKFLSIFNNNMINKGNSCLKSYSKNNHLLNTINNINNKKLNIHLDIIQNRNASLSIKKHSLNNKNRRYISNSIIDSISNKIKKESQNYISKRIYNIINSNRNKKNILNSSQKNTISLKKYFQINKMKNFIKNKLLISSLEKNTFQNNKDVLGSFTYNSNNSINKINMNKVPKYNFKKININNFSSPNSIKKNISFRQFINNNFSTINNTYNCQLFTDKDDIYRANNTLYSTNNNFQKIRDKILKNKYVYDINKLNNKKVLKINGCKDKKLVLNTNNKKKILIVRKKDKRITNNYDNSHNNNAKVNNKNKKYNKSKNKREEMKNLKIGEYEKIKIITPKEALDINGNIKNKYINLKNNKKSNNNIVLKKISSISINKK